ncbi:MAG: glycosyltransferase [Solirubrobacterales bacterium]|nr:glycosyltransferase [Solirubrobacterales bacterium]
MKICLVQPPPADFYAGGRVERLADLLSARHDLVVIESEAEPSAALAGLSFAGAGHRRSAAVLEALHAAYGRAGPDYLELPDSSPVGLVALQARQTGEGLLARTLVGVRISPSSELREIHNGTLSRPARWQIAELEREQLRLADRLVWPGGDSLDLYRRYYTEVELPEPIRIGLPVEAGSPASPSPRDPRVPLKILSAGPLERRSGTLDLVEACLALADERWGLTLIGADTPSATMAQSVALTIEAMGADDERIAIEEPLPLEQLRCRLPEFDLVVVPARVEAWSEVAIEAMRAGVPVLATPVGGLVEIVADGVCGWHTADIGADAIAAALTRLQGDRGQLERVRNSGALAARVADLADPAPILAAYGRLADDAADAASPTGAAATDQPLVTGIVPYHGLPEYVSEAVASLLAQSHRKLEVLIVNDGSFAAADAVLDELAEDPRVRVVTQPNRGESEARNLGARLARGDYLMMLDADNALEPRFVERALLAFALEPQLAYVTCWLRMVDESGIEFADRSGYAPLGNAVVAADSENWDGDTIAMLPRRLFTEQGYGYGPRGSMHSDWELYRWLRQEGRFGAVIPECLARYRIRPGSLLRGHGEELQALGWTESRDRNRHRRMQWIAGR